MRQKVGASNTVHKDHSKSDTSSVSMITTYSNSNTNNHRRAPSRARAFLDSIQEFQDDNANNTQGAAVFDTVTVTSSAPDATAVTIHHRNTTTAELNQVASSSEQLITGAALVEELFDGRHDAILPPVALVETIDEGQINGGAVHHDAARDFNNPIEAGGMASGETLPLTSNDYTGTSYQHSSSFAGGSIKSGRDTHHSMIGSRQPKDCHTTFCAHIAVATPHSFAKDTCQNVPGKVHHEKETADIVLAARDGLEYLSPVTFLEMVLDLF
jgi:hypothetical protein